MNIPFAGNRQASGLKNSIHRDKLFTEADFYRRHCRTGEKNMNRIQISLPCGSGVMSAEVPTTGLLGIFRSRLAAAGSEEELVEAALEQPLGSPRLEELASGRRNAVIITSDHTRPVPSRIIMPRLLSRLRRGSPDIDITILIATGCHRAPTREELIEKFGAELFAAERIVCHDCDDESLLVRVGTLPSGGELVVNRLAAETELLISEGFIEPHFFAGYSGGRKSVLPGIAARRTVLANHCAEFINDPHARTGVLENNPIHRDMLAAARQLGLAFILNVVIDENKRIVHAVAGEPERAHAAGCEFLRSRCTLKVPVADIVVTGNGGHPLDQNVYQAVKGMTAAEAVCRPGGIIIMVAACGDGHGGESFYRQLRDAESPVQLLGEISRRSREQTEPDQWQTQILARVLSRHRVIMVTNDRRARQLIVEMHMEAAATLEEALRRAGEVTGKNAKTAVIPDGVAVVTVPEVGFGIKQSNAQPGRVIDGKTQLD